jgi:hypothetical protein
VCTGLISSRCPICGDDALLVADLAPFEAMGVVVHGVSMCARHWSNFAQGMAQSHGLTLLRSEERGFTLSD